MTQRTLIAMFGSRAQAERAAQALRGLDLGLAGVTVHDVGGPWPEAGESAIWPEGARPGTALVVASIAEAGLDLALDAMETAGALNLETREAGWRAPPGPRGDSVASRFGPADEADVMGEGAHRPAGSADEAANDPVPRDGKGAA